MANADAVLISVRARFMASLAAAPNWGVSFVGGKVIASDRFIVLFRWMDDPRVFGAAYVVAEYAAMFDPDDPDSLADNIVSNDLAGPPGEGDALVVPWADGLVSNPEKVRWVGFSKSVAAPPH